MVGATEMCAFISQSKPRLALQVFESVFLGTLIPGVLVGAALGLYWAQWPLWLLCLHVFLCVRTGHLHDVYRSEGMLARGTHWNNALRLIEGCAVAGVALLGAGLTLAAGSQVLVRFIGFCLMARDLKRRFVWFRPTGRGFRLSVLRRLCPPSLAYVLMPVGDQVSGNALSVMIGSALGPAALGNFSTLRTMANAAAVPAGMIRNATLPELSAFMARNENRNAQQLYRWALERSFWITLLFLGAAAVLGPWIYPHWTHKQWVFDPAIFWMLLIGVFFSGLWQAAALPAFARNDHLPLTLFRTLLYGLLLLWAFWGLPLEGMAVGSVGLALVEGIMWCVSVWYVRRYAISLDKTAETPDI